MTLEERVARIEKSLIAAGLMLPDPMPTKEEVLRDLKNGDSESLRRLLREQYRTGRTNEWPFGSKKNRRGGEAAKKAASANSPWTGAGRRGIRGKIDKKMPPS